MGISGMLRGVLRKAGRKVDLRANPDFLKDKRMAVDISGWLHRAIWQGAKDIVERGARRQQSAGRHWPTRSI
jgi:hypothetical protein